MDKQMYQIVENNSTLYVEPVQNMHLWDDVPNQIRGSEVLTLDEAKALAAELEIARNIRYGVKVEKVR